MNEFIKGDKKARDEKLTMYLQLGPSQHGLSALAWVGLKGLCTLIDLSFPTYNNDKEDINSSSMIDIPTISTNDDYENDDNDRTSFHGFNLSMYATKTHHFTGDNYISTTSYIDGDSISNTFIRYLYQSYVEKGLFARNVIDLSFVLKGGNAREKRFDAPECVLGTVRFVHVDANAVALPSEIVLGSDRIIGCNSDDDVKRHLDGVNALPITKEGKAGDDNGDFTKEIEALKEILSDITVPIRSRNKSSFAMSQSFVANQDDSPESFTRVPVLANLTNNGLRRFYIASNSDLETCALRIVNTVSWSNITFPIDKRLCKIELQSGQCFFSTNVNNKISRDKAGNPIIYFRAMLKGIWRKDIDASILATLHRIHTCFQSFDGDREVKLTAIILLGYPPLDQQSSKTMASDEEKSSEPNEQSTANNPVTNILPRIQHHFQTQNNNNNDPRIHKKEEYTPHINLTFIQRLTSLLLQHYPERLAFAYIVQQSQHSSSKKMTNVFNKTGIKIKIRNMISSEKTRKKIVILDDVDDLKKYVDESELVIIAGGSVAVPDRSFTC